MNWKKRMKIIIGIAEGLEYLHEKSQPKMIKATPHTTIDPNKIQIIIVLDNKMQGILGPPSTSPVVD